MPEPKSECESPEAPGASAPAAAGLWYRRSVTAALVVYWLLMFAATHVPRIPQEMQPGFSDKWQHYVAYAGLGFLLAAWWSLRRRLPWSAALILLAVAALYGALDEITQPLFGRDGELLDWRSDVIGAATGLVLFALVTRLFAKRRAKRAAPVSEQV